MGRRKRCDWCNTRVGSEERDAGAVRDGHSLCTRCGGEVRSLGSRITAYRGGGHTTLWVASRRSDG